MGTACQSFIYLFLFIHLFIVFTKKTLKTNVWVLQ